MKNELHKVAVEIKKAILKNEPRKVYISPNRDYLAVAPVVNGFGAPVGFDEVADVSLFLEDAWSFCDNTPFAPGALDYLRGFDADDAPESFVELLENLLRDMGARIDDV